MQDAEVHAAEDARFKPWAVSLSNKQAITCGHSLFSSDVRILATASQGDPTVEGSMRTQSSAVTARTAPIN
jgi:hypothetical protein